MIKNLTDGWTEISLAGAANFVITARGNRPFYHLQGAAGAPPDAAHGHLTREFVADDAIGAALYLRGDGASVFVELRS